ncbi:MAG TPA: ATP-binding protein [Magnetospirillaceae bacterium]|nr:ATP-binding protein [Magnetospirillaceae bacterium]
MSIRTKLTLIMLAIGLIPTVLVSGLAFATISSELTNKTEDQLASVATSRQQKVTSLLQKRQEEATKLANQFDLQSALTRYIAHEPRAAQDIYAILLSKKSANPEIQAVSLINLDGLVVAATVAGNDGKTLLAEEYFIPAGQESNISVREDQRDGIDKLTISLKININKKESGYLILVFRMDDIVATIQDYTGLGTTGETVVAGKVGTDGAISLFPLRFDTDAALKTRLDSLKILTPSEETYHQATDYRGNAVLVTSRSIGFADWVLATKIDLDEALAPINQLRTSLIIIVGMFTLALVALSLYLTRFFTKPIMLVSKVAERFGKGDFSSRVDFKRADEIGALGSSINTMGHSLQDFVASLESQRNRLAIILNSTAESIMAIDKNGTILLANAATSELTQLPGSSIVGQPISTIFIWKRDLQDFAIDYGKAGTNTYPELEFTDASGTIHYLKAIVAQVSGRQEAEQPQTIVTIHDETKSRDLENMKVDFVSMAAHELRTPLAATRGYLELISFKEGENVAPDVKNYLSQALKSTAELGGLIDNLLGVTRIERGTLTLRPEKVDIALDIQQAIRNANFGANDKRITITYDGPASDCYIIADQIALHEVINNLINNAIKYNNSGGNVAVSLAQKDKNYVIRFKDTGIGIPKQAIPNLFTKFYRVHGGLNSGSTGTGLGLFISKSIIERHGGTINVESEEGVGSTFTITLPVLDPTKLAAAKASQQPHTPTRGNRGWTTKNITR